MPATKSERIRNQIDALSDPKRRERAKYYLIRHYAERGRNEMEAALRHEDWLVRTQLTGVVARMGGDWGYQMLRTLLADPVEEVRYDAAIFHKSFPDSATAHDLKAVIENATDSVRSAAFTALQMIGEPGIPILRELTEHPDAEVARTARELLKARRRSGSCYH